jgi:RimJ/RimL family protein N-acetyltransferase
LKAVSMVYIVDPDHAMGTGLAALLGAYQIPVEHFTDTQHFLESTQSRDIANDCLFLALELPGSSAMDLLRQLSAGDNHLPIIMVGQNIATDQRSEAIGAGASDAIERSLLGSYLFNRLTKIMRGNVYLPEVAPCCIPVSDGTLVTFRMMHPDDAEKEQEFVVALSDESRYLRFFSSLKELPSYILKEFTSPEYPVSFAVIATIDDGGEERQIGVARYSPTGTDDVAEFAVVVADEWHGLGVASQLMHLVTTAAVIGGINRLEGLVLKENVAMLAMAKEMGFTIVQDHEEGPSVVHVIKDLRDTPEQAS